MASTRPSRQAKSAAITAISHTERKGTSAASVATHTERKGSKRHRSSVDSPVTSTSTSTSSPKADENINGASVAAPTISMPSTPPRDVQPAKKKPRVAAEPTVAAEPVVGFPKGSLAATLMTTTLGLSDSHYEKFIDTKPLLRWYMLDNHTRPVNDLSVRDLLDLSKACDSARVCILKDQDAGSGIDVAFHQQRKRSLDHLQTCTAEELKRRERWFGHEDNSPNAKLASGLKELHDGLQEQVLRGGAVASAQAIGISGALQSAVTSNVNQPAKIADAIKTGNIALDKLKGKRRTKLPTITEQGSGSPDTERESTVETMRRVEREGEARIKKASDDLAVMRNAEQTRLILNGKSNSFGSTSPAAPADTTTESTTVSPTVVALVALAVASSTFPEFQKRMADVAASMTAETVPTVVVPTDNAKSTGDNESCVKSTTDDDHKKTTDDNIEHTKPVAVVRQRSMTAAEAEVAVPAAAARAIEEGDSQSAFDEME